jgi:hypothetical protein
MTHRILTGLTLALALACGRIDLGSYGMGGMASNTDDDDTEQSVSQRPPDVIIIGPVTSETTFEPGKPGTERPGEIGPGDEETDEALPSGPRDLDAGAADAGDGGVAKDAEAE